jgi:hypothetical protein
MIIHPVRVYVWHKYPGYPDLERNQGIMMSKKYLAVLSVVFVMAFAGTTKLRAESHPKAKTEVVRKGLILDLDADRGIKMINGRVASWKNQVDWKVKTFIATRDASHKKGIGHPKLKEKVTAIGGHNTMVFY